MKRHIITPLVLLALTLTTACSMNTMTPPSPTVAAPAVQQNATNSRILEAYFSRYGNTNYDASVDASTSASIVDHDGQRMGTTELMARDIQQQVQGDLFLIHAATPYPTNFDDVVDQNHTEAAQRTIEAAGVPVRIDKLLPAKRPNPVTSAKIRTPWRKIRKNYTLFPQQHTLTCMISQNTSIKLSKN